MNSMTKCVKSWEKRTLKEKKKSRQKSLNSLRSDAKSARAQGNQKARLSLSRFFWRKAERIWSQSTRSSIQPSRIWNHYWLQYFSSIFSLLEYSKFRLHRSNRCKNWSGLDLYRFLTKALCVKYRGRVEEAVCLLVSPKSWFS